MLGKMKWKAPREHAVEELSTYRARARHYRIKNKKTRILNQLITLTFLLSSFSCLTRVLSSCTTWVLRFSAMTSCWPAWSPSSFRRFLYALVYVNLEKEGKGEPNENDAFDHCLWKATIPNPFEPANQAVSID